MGSSFCCSVLFTWAFIFYSHHSQAHCKDPTSVHTSTNMQLKRKGFISCEKLRADLVASPAAIMRLVNKSETVPLSISCGCILLPCITSSRLCGCRAHLHSVLGPPRSDVCLSLCFTVILQNDMTLLNKSIKKWQHNGLKFMTSKAGFYI